MAKPPKIDEIRDNRTSFPLHSVPKYAKLEISISLETSALNPYWPFDAVGPPGIPGGVGVSVDGLFSPDGWETTYSVPGFFYQEFEDNPALPEWHYPKEEHLWKIRFAPYKEGSWEYLIRVKDAGGTVQSPVFKFNVANSSTKGFIRVSKEDPRYFEHSGGKYFPGLGQNLNHRQIDWVDPSSNEITFQNLQANGIQLVRTWISQWSIFGSTWGKWLSQNRAHQTQEPQMGLTHEHDQRFQSLYPELAPPTSPGDFYMWVNHDETASPDGELRRFTPCRVFGWEAARVPLKRNRTYRVRVRYQVQGLKGPKVVGQPFGFVVKEGGWLWPASEIGRCDDPGSGNVLAATYELAESDPWTSFNDPDFPAWRILEGRFDNGERDFIEYLYLALENVKTTDGGSAGHAFIDHVWLQEDLGDDRFGPNLIYKPSMDHHYYINQRDALALDKILELAAAYDVYLKAVILEKNDFIFNSLEFQGGKASVSKSELFYGNGREESGKTKVRWLQESWWRYLQARWGYSPNIHSWELLNEGPPGPEDNPHWILADEFGKFIKCRVFELEEGDTCSATHPNAHLVTSSFWSGFPFHFWNNTSGGYSNVDYADIHQRVAEGDGDFEDAAAAAESFSMNHFNSLGESARKPIIRGEVAWLFSATDEFKSNVSNGVWLHNFVWGGINPGGLMELYWDSPPTDGHIVGDTHNHRGAFKAFYEFIKDIPLNNGKYVDAGATASSPEVRVWGQRDAVNQRAHLWIQNRHHTWANIRDHTEIPVVQSTVSVAGLSGGKSFWIQWWDTSSGDPMYMESGASDSEGNLVFVVDSLASDTAVQIWPVASHPKQPPSPKKLQIFPSEEVIIKPAGETSGPLE